MGKVCVRKATRQDAGQIVRLVRALAEYENEPVDIVKTTEADVLRHGFGERPYFEVLLAELDSEPVGFALYFHNYSTWEGCPGIYVEDLFVETSARGKGIGRRLLTVIAAIAHRRGCRRIDLSVLHWNPTREFYHRIGMAHMDEWLLYRMRSTEIATLAAQADTLFDDH